MKQLSKEEIEKENERLRKENERLRLENLLLKKVKAIVEEREARNKAIGRKPYIMTQDERWNLRYQEVIDFIETNHRNPSKHRIEEHDMLNWLKQQRKLHNAGKLNLNRVERLKKLLELIEQYRRKNQYG